MTRNPSPCHLLTPIIRETGTRPPGPLQRNCTVKKADILAVLDELVETMRDQLQDSKRVKLDGFGSFAHRVHPRAQYRCCRQPREAVPAGCEVRRAA